jgi:hypothetical protein
VLLLSLLPSVGLRHSGPARFRVELEGENGGAYDVECAPGRAAVSTADGEAVDLVLRGTPAMLAPLAVGGAMRGRGRGGWVRVQGSHRSHAQLLRACRRPLSLAELVQAGLAPPPRLLLAAVAEAIDARLVAGRSFAVAFRFEGGGEGLIATGGAGAFLVWHPRAADDPPPRGDGAPAAVVRCSEAACLALFAGLELPAGEQVLVEGDAHALSLLLRLSDAAQGLRAS